MNNLILSETYTRPPEKVFAAFSTAKVFARWIAPSDDMPTVIETYEFKTEGRFRIRFRVGPETFYVSGQFPAIVANRTITFTWMREAPAPHAKVESHVTVPMTGCDGHTELTLAHSCLGASGMMDRHRLGWHGSLVRLRHTLKDIEK